MDEHRSRKRTARVGRLALVVLGLAALASACLPVDPVPVLPISPVDPTAPPVDPTVTVALTAPLKVDFSDPNTVPATGYVRDHGQGYGPRTGPNQGTGFSYGWVQPGTHTPINLTANGRNRNLAPTNAGIADVRLATFMHMQYTATQGTRAPGSWEVAVDNGTYTVTVSAGEPTYVDSVHAINVEGVALISGFVQTTQEKWRAATAQVTVTDGILTVDATGGTNTKIQYIDISPGTGAVQHPSVRSTSPANGATNVSRDVPVTAEVVLPNVGQGIDGASINASTVQLVRASDSAVVPANRNTTGGGDAIIVQPTVLLDANTTYRFTVTDGVKDLSGATFVPASMTFTTGTAGGGGSSSVSFNKVALPTASANAYSSVVMGPDGKLYAGTLDGLIHRFTINADGTLGAPQVISSLQTANGGARLLSGFAFDPASTATNLIVWASNNAYAFTDAPNWTGKITRLSGPNLATVQDYVINLPRSIRDHVTNQPAFGPDGALYVQQGAMNSGGAPDNTWGMRPETLLSAAILRINLAAITSPPLNVKTAEGGTYNPFAINAPVKVHASGVRNGYDLVWHSNGQLYVPTNGSATGGKTPATPSPLPAACSNARIDSATNGAYTGPAVPADDMNVAEHDWLHRVVAGGYYGHPDPARCEWVLNGGNPTAGVNPNEWAEYPVGVQPDRNWRGPSFDMGEHYSPNGVIEYTGTGFNGALQGKLLVVRYSAGDDIEVLTPGGPSGAISASQTNISGFTGFVDPVDLVQGPNGTIYVSELGANKLTLLRPATATGTTTSISADKARLVYNDVQGGAASAAQTVTVTNTGTADLSVSSVTITGANANQFTLQSPPAVPFTVAPSATRTFSVVFNPTSTGPKKATLTLTTNTTPATFTVDLSGLGTLGQGGASEPSLQWILDTYDIPVNVGDPNPADNALPLAPPVSDEVAMPRFVKAGTGPVTVTPLAVFGPTTTPVFRFGWYPAGNTAGRTQLFTVPSTSAQTLNVQTAGALSFDPGAAAFGFWNQWPAFSERLVYQEDAFNTFPGAYPHQFKVFPLKAPDGTTVANSYVVATEESTGDWNDIPVIVTNVKAEPGVGGPRAVNLNLDGVPANDRMVFSRIGATLTNPFTVHDVAVQRITNTGGANLTITGATFTGPWQLVNPAQIPAVVAPGASIDVPIRFVAVGGAKVQTGSVVFATTDPARPTIPITLAAIWQPASESGEPSLVNLINQTYGFKTVLLNAGQTLSRAGRIEAVGEEVLSPHWVRADTTQPVSARWLGAWHTQSNIAFFSWLNQGSTATNLVMVHKNTSAQSILPLNNSNGPGSATFTPSPVFHLKIDGEDSVDANNIQTADRNNGCPGPCGHHVRFWPLKNAAGTVVPDTYLMVMDYSGVNYDYNDNVMLLTNLRPA